jgi:MFS family permease
MRGYQPTPGILMSLSWVTENNGLFVLSVGTLGILFSTFAAWGRLPKRFERLPSMLEKRDATLLISLLVSFLAFLGLQGFVYPYMVYAIWPVLSLGAGMTLGYAGNRIQTGFFFHTPRSSQKHLALLILCFLVVGVVAGNISITVQASDFEGTWSRTERKSLDDAAQFIEGQTKPSDSVLSFIPSLSLLIDRPRVLPDNPSGGNLDLINYFPLRAFYEILDNGTKPFNPLELLKIRSDLTRVQTRLQAQELSGMLSTAKILVLDEQRLTAFIPEYDQTFGAVISEKCEFLRAFGTDGWIRIYSVR